MIADDITTDGSYDPYCTLQISSEPWLNASVWIGFDPTFQSYCQLDNDEEYSYLTADPTDDPTADPTDDPTVSPTNPTFSPTHDSTMDPTVSPSSAPSFVPSNHPSTSPSVAPTNAPSISPTAAPSFSPTQHPITYSDFQSSVTAFFKITGWTNSEISDVNDDIQSFADSLTMHIHQGFDNDDTLEYQDLVLEMRLMNEYSLDYLSNKSDSDSGHILWQSIDNGMDLQYLINCSRSLSCIYIESDDPENGLNDTVFEAFVSDKLNSHFISTDTRGNYNLKFIVERITMDAIETTTSSSDTAELGTEDSYPLLIGILCSVMLVSALFSLIAFLAVHRRRPGTDRPNYLSLLKFGFNAADFYTDLIWSLSLISENSEYAVYAFVFTIGSYAVSLIVAILYVTKWKASHHSKEHLSGYATKYSKYVLIGTALAGFYATVEIVTSHLCHIGVLSLHITTAQKQHIQTLRILNVVLLENLPLFIIQSLYLSSGSGDKQSEDLTMITIMFSSLSIISGISDGITNVFSRYITKRNQSDTVNNKMFIEFSVKERVPGHIHSYHIHSCNKLQCALAASLEIEENQVVIHKIQHISSGLLVVAKLKFLSDEQVSKLSAELQNEQSQMRVNLRRECTNNLEIKVPRYVELNEFKVRTDDLDQVRTEAKNEGDPRDANQDARRASNSVDSILEKRVSYTNTLNRMETITVYEEEREGVQYTGAAGQHTQQPYAHPEVQKECT